MHSSCRQCPAENLVIAVVAAVGITAAAIPLAIRNADTPTLAAMDVAGTAPPKWEDGYRHLVVTYDAHASDDTSSPAAAPSDAGSQKASDGRTTEATGRWIAISQGGVDHRMTAEQRAALVPWIRVYAADTDGAVWGQLDPAAPVELGGQAAPGSIQGHPVEPDTSPTHTDPEEIAVETGRETGVKTDAFLIARKGRDTARNARSSGLVSAKHPSRANSQFLLPSPRSLKRPR